MSKPQVIIIDDYKPIQEKFRRDIRKEKLDIELVQFYNLTDARRALQSRLREGVIDDVKMMFIDGEIPPDTFRSTLDFIKEFRPVFPGLMIAISTDDYKRRLMVETGCDESIEKWDTVRRIKDRFQE